MLNFLRNILLILCLFSCNNAFGLNSSSFLIVNTALKLYDFDKAKIEFDQINSDLGESNLHGQLLTYVNLGLLKQANFIAKKIISINKLNQEAWIVCLANAKLKNDKKVFDKFELIKNKSEFDLINYIFFFKNGNIKSKELIAQSIFEVIQTTVNQHNDNIDYRFLLFHLSISTMMDSNFNKAYFYKAEIYNKLKKYSKAELYYNKISITDNLFFESQKNIALNKSKVGLHDEGIKLLKNILVNKENNLILTLALADLYRFQKNYKEAIRFYTKIIKSKDNSFNEYWKIYYLRGICFERINKWELAEEDFLYSLKIKPNSPHVLNYLAYGWLERDVNIKEAMHMLKQAYKNQPDSFYIADSLAWAFYKNNELRKASNLMEKVIIMAPGEAISLSHLGDIYFALNRKREASYYWKQALDLAMPEDNITEKLIQKLEDYNAR